MSSIEEALKEALMSLDWEHEVSLGLYKLYPYKITNYPSYVYPEELSLPASERHTVSRTGFDDYGRPRVFIEEPPVYSKVETECEHNCCDPYLEGYICMDCGKWFTYEEEATGRYKRMLQEKLEIYEQFHKK